MSMPWYVYLIENKAGQLYAGMTNDPVRRISQHRGEKPGGAKALKGKAPLKFRAVFEVASRSQAMKTEYQLKQLSRAQKLALISHTDLPDATWVTPQFEAC